MHCINIWKSILYKYILPSISNLRCTPSYMQMYPMLGTLAYNINNFVFA